MAWIYFPSNIRPTLKYISYKSCNKLQQCYYSYISPKQEDHPTRHFQFPLSFSQNFGQEYRILPWFWSLVESSCKPVHSTAYDCCSKLPVKLLRDLRPLLLTLTVGRLGFRSLPPQSFTRRIKVLMNLPPWLLFHCLTCIPIDYITVKGTCNIIFLLSHYSIKLSGCLCESVINTLI